jgi:hypothetical protein
MTRTPITANDTMSHAELLAAYNSISPTKRNAMFKSKEEALARINALVPAAVEATPEISEAAPEVTPEVTVTKIPTGMTAKKAAAAERAAAKKAALAETEATKSKKSAKKSAEKFTVGRDAKMVKGRGIDAKIKLLVDAYPRREGTDAHRHWALMKDGISVREYLANFSPGIDARRARQWLFNHSRSGFVALEEDEGSRA